MAAPTLREAAASAREALAALLRTIRNNAPPFSGKTMGDAEVAISAIDAALAAQQAAPRCACKDRPADQCPGEWEPGCDLGANKAHVRVVQKSALAQPSGPTEANLQSPDYWRGYAAGVKAPHTEAAPAPTSCRRQPYGDLRNAKWLDPECYSAGACQSLKFKAAPAQARQPLTERQVSVLVQSHGTGGWQTASDMSIFARAIEAAHGIGTSTEKK